MPTALSSSQAVTSVGRGLSFWVVIPCMRFQYRSLEAHVFWLATPHMHLAVSTQPPGTQNQAQGSP